MNLSQHVENDLRKTVAVWRARVRVEVYMIRAGLPNRARIGPSLRFAFQHYRISWRRLRRHLLASRSRAA